MAKTHSVAEKMRLLEPTAQIWMKIDPYYQRRKCRPNDRSFWKYKVYGDIRGGSSWRGRQVRVGLTTTATFGDLSGYFFRIFRDKASSIIWRHGTHCHPITDCKMNDPEWPWVAISCQNQFWPALCWRIDASFAAHCTNLNGDKHILSAAKM